MSRIIFPRTHGSVPSYSRGQRATAAPTSSAAKGKIGLLSRLRMLRAGFNLNRDVAERVKVCQFCLVGRRRLRMVRYDRHDRRLMARSDLPKVQVGHAIAVCFEPLAYGLLALFDRH